MCSVKDFRVSHERLALEIPSVLKDTVPAKHSPCRGKKEFTLSINPCHGHDWLSLMGVFLGKNQEGLGFLFVLCSPHTSQASCRDMFFCLSLPAPATQIPARSQVFNGHSPAHYLVVPWLSRVRRSVLVVFFPSLCLQYTPFSETMSTFIPVPTELYEMIQWEMREWGG